MAGLLGKKVYAVLDGTGRLLATGSKRRMSEEAIAHARENNGIAVIQEEEDPDLHPNGTGDGGIQAYENTGLQAICEAKYGQPYLDAELVESISIPDAWERVRDYLPNAQKWQEDGWSQHLLKGFLAQNAKLAHTESPDGKPGLTVGLSLAPHQVGLRGYGDPTDHGFLLPKSINTEVVKDKLFGTRVKNNSAALRKMSGVALRPKTKRGQPKDTSKLRAKAAFTVCFRSSPGCRAACLVHSGQNPASNEALNAKLALTAALYHDPAAFMRLLLANCRRFFKRAQTKDKEGWDLYVRLNVLSDMPWEHFFPDLMDPRMKLAMREPDYKGREKGSWRNRKIIGKGSWYDYTKIPFREERHAEDHAERYGISYAQAYKETKAFYPLTFSYSGTPPNAREAQATLRAGGKVTVVFVLEGTDTIGGHTYSAGLKKVQVDSSRHVARTFGKLSKINATLVKQVWTYAAHGEVGRTLERWLHAQGIRHPGEKRYDQRHVWAADVLSDLLGRNVTAELLDDNLPQSEGALRYPYAAKYKKVGGRYIDKPVIKKGKQVYHTRGPNKGEPKTRRVLVDYEEVMVKPPDWMYPMKFWGYPVINGDANDIRAKDSQLVKGGAIVGLDFKVPKIKIGKGRFKSTNIDVAENAFVTALREVDGMLIVPQTPEQTLDGEVPAS